MELLSIDKSVSVSFHIPMRQYYSCSN